VRCGTGEKKTRAFSTNLTSAATFELGTAKDYPRSAQEFFGLRRRFGVEMLPDIGSEASQGLPTVRERERAESPRTARVHLRLWLDSGFYVGMEATTSGALAIEHIGRARSRGRGISAYRRQLRSACEGRAGPSTAPHRVRRIRPTPFSPTSGGRIGVPRNSIGCSLITDDLPSPTSTMPAGLPSSGTLVVFSYGASDLAWPSRTRCIQR
jgi:hypothetical protein